MFLNYEKYIFFCIKNEKNTKIAIEIERTHSTRTERIGEPMLNEMLLTDFTDVLK